MCLSRSSLSNGSGPPPPPVPVDPASCTEMDPEGDPETTGTRPGAAAIAVAEGEPLARAVTARPLDLMATKRGLEVIAAERLLSQWVSQDFVLHIWKGFDFESLT